MKQRILFTLALSALLTFGPGQIEAKPGKGKISAEKGSSSAGGSSKKKSKKVGSETIRYEVRSGDTVGSIATEHGVRVSDIVRWNNLASADKIHIGQMLKLRTVSGGSSSRSSSSRKDRKVTIVVRKGDSLSKIAKTNGVTIKDLMKWNRALRKSPDQLRVGQKIAIWVDAPEVQSGSVGTSNKGRLSNGEQLPKGNGYYRRKPHNEYGTNLTISHIITVMAKYDAKFKKAPRFAIGDISSEKGGKLKPHKSHQSGRDVDIGYVDSNGKDLQSFEKMNADTLDVEKNWYVIKEFVDTGDVEYIFVDYKLQKLLYDYAKKKGVKSSYLSRVFQYPNGKNNRRGVIRHARGHNDHMHIRFTCPKNDDKCR